MRRRSSFRTPLFWALPVQLVVGTSQWVDFVVWTVWIRSCLGFRRLPARDLPGLPRRIGDRCWTRRRTGSGGPCRSAPPAKCDRFSRSMTGPFTSDRWSVTPPSFSRRLMASRLSSAEASMAFTAGHSRMTWRIAGFGGDRAVDPVLEEAGVGEVEALVDPQRQDLRARSPPRGGRRCGSARSPGSGPPPPRAAATVRRGAERSTARRPATRPASTP